MKTESWLSPMNKAIWIKAFRNKEKSATIRDGRKFTIRYSTKTHFGQKKEMALVTPTSGFAPSGWFELARVVDQLWMTQPDNYGEGAAPNKVSIYITLLDEFIKAGYDGVEVMDHWPTLEGRLPATIRQGFASAILARGKLAADISVMTIEGVVFLLKEVDKVESADTA